MATLYETRQVMCDTFRNSVRDIVSLLTSLHVDGTHNIIMCAFFSYYQRNQVKSHKIAV